MMKSRSAFRWLGILGAGLLVNMSLAACGPEESLETADTAKATFDWGGDCDGGSGAFSQTIAYRATVEVGEIPAGKRNVRIELSSSEDVDIQLYDKATGHAIIAWPYGDLNGAGLETAEYRGVAYSYSGYNGVDGDWGHEFIEILGDTNRELVMKAYGYAAGTATVDYEWGVGVGELCGGTTNPPLQPCADGLYCKSDSLSLSQPGQCHTDDWCLNDELAFHHCGSTLDTPRTPGAWSCVEFQCQWRPLSECELKGGICTHFMDPCPEGTYSESPMGCPLGRSGQCCLPFGEEIELSRADDGATVELQKNDVLVLELDRGPVHPCYGGEWQESSIDGGAVLDLLDHEVVPNPDCLGVGCYHEMDRFRFVARDTGSPEELDFSIDQGDAPDWCENEKIGTFRLHVVVP
jgi:hypothetical protein